MTKTRTALRAHAVPVGIVMWLLAHLLLSGRWWVWNLFSVLPSAFFLLPFLALIAWSLYKRSALGFLCVLLALPLVWLQTDVQIPRSGNTSSTDTVTVFNWNTGFWHQEEEKDVFYALLKAQEADVYHLQEHVDRQYRPLANLPEIQAQFPDYRLITKGEFVTFTRLPVLEAHTDEEGDFLRVDMEVQGRRISFYNVHIPLQLQPWLLKRPLRMLSDMRTRFFRRRQQFQLLRTAIRDNPSEIFLSGDFNTTVPMGSIRPILRPFQDAQRAGTTFFPRTWQILGLRLWRIDFTLLSPSLTVLSHEDIETSGLSDHSAQRVRFATQ